jgi:hypothetical protein
MEKGHWQFDEEFDIKEWFGFIYRITENTTNREYIGKKQFFSNRTKTVVGKKNKKHFKKESDWKTYTSSSIELNKSIILYGKENYTFDILSLHKTKGTLHYSEVELQILENVLRERLEDGSRKYYNGHIAAVKFIPPSEHNEQTKSKISKKLIDRYKDKANHWINQLSDIDKEQFAVQFLRGQNHGTRRTKSKEEYQSWVDHNCRGENNPMFGKDPWNKGKTWEELFSLDEANKLRQILAEKCVKNGENNGMFGRKHSEEQIKKWQTDSRRIHIGEENGMFGKPCHYKMDEEEIAKWKENISKASKGKPKSAEWKEKIGQAHKGKKKPTVECPHCKKIGAKGNMLRYHFDNCKFKV